MGITQSVNYFYFLIKRNIKMCRYFAGIFALLCITKVIQNLEKSNEMAFKTKMNTPFIYKMNRKI